MEKTSDAASGRAQLSAQFQLALKSGHACCCLDGCLLGAAYQSAAYCSFLSFFHRFLSLSMTINQISTHQVLQSPLSVTPGTTILLGVLVLLSLSGFTTRLSPLHSLVTNVIVTADLRRNGHPRLANCTLQRAPFRLLQRYRQLSDGPGEWYREQHTTGACTVLA